MTRHDEAVGGASDGLKLALLLEYVLSVELRAPPLNRYPFLLSHWLRALRSICAPTRMR